MQHTNNLCSTRPKWDVFGKFLYRLVANALENELGGNSEPNKKISLLCGNNSSFVDSPWGIWRWGDVAVPLSKTQPTQSLEYYVKDSDSSAVTATRELIDKVHPDSRKK